MLAADESLALERGTPLFLMCLATASSNCQFASIFFAKKGPKTPLLWPLEVAVNCGQKALMIFGCLVKPVISELPFSDSWPPVVAAAVVGGLLKMLHFPSWSEAIGWVEGAEIILISVICCFNLAHLHIYHVK